ncbi:putative 4-hydroxyphenylpyruvate dioxygenase [Aspergillus campestris IBT 28561]|uniref:4-hydroxyphenylpyruvate dioxygenase n=1 Tax=Aspergillus campestris (strain IBT 28561) TaxID=1392248 RepID=A0A2I1DDC2_ASPC2|nr:putative 4-hydroxyphenylpyruvate dioxygenase [Aspergillus campestris IBT 28561]PKY07878.1 putative 4-hydroxyphenylpyruvate dioxygenase [Aspergillus campestris IBT 28561]
MPCQPAITTVSLGQSQTYTIQEKLHACAKHNIHGIELFYDDLEALARSSSPSITLCADPHTQQPPKEALLNAATQIHTLATTLDIQILSLQPLRFAEGLVNRSEQARILTDVLPLWLSLAQALHTDTILIASNFLPPDPRTGEPRITGDTTTITDDLRALAKAAAPTKLAYEALAWSPHIHTWEAAYDVVKRVNEPNFGLAVDAFNIAAAMYPSPDVLSSPSSMAAADTALTQSLARLVADVDPTRLFVVQMADAERLLAPLDELHPFYEAAQPARMSWSRNARLFLGEAHRGGFLPVVEVVKAVVLGLGWEGWLSFEVFSRFLVGPGDVPFENAERAARSWEWVVEQVWGEKSDTAC